ncbi:hypothetical protein JX266_002196 [Neoarthrinium moseri]|nr:hypothetical protein JX266_002196 [Neoarthrinium moseri]
MASDPTDLSTAPGSPGSPGSPTNSVPSDDERYRDLKRPGVSPKRESPYRSINLKANKAFITWNGANGQTEVLGCCQEGKRFVTIHFTANMDAHTGLFRILIPLDSATVQKPVNLYMFIAPESIHSVSLDESGSDIAQKELQTQTHCLRFTLSRTVSLVIPKSLDPTSLDSIPRFASVRALAAQTDFSIYIPAKTCSKPELRALCDAVSSPTPGYKADPRSSNINSLYAGEGGQLLEDSPPGYEDPTGPILAQGPAAEPELDPDQTLSKKRRRRSSSSTSQERQSSKIMSILERLTESVDTLLARVNQMSSRLDRLESHMENMTENLQNEFERALQDTRDETQNTLDGTYEDLLWTAQDNLKDHVNEQIAEMEDRASRRIVRSLRNAAVTLQLDLVSEGDSP